MKYKSPIMEPRLPLHTLVCDIRYLIRKSRDPSLSDMAQRVLAEGAMMLIMSYRCDDNWAVLVDRR